MEPPIEPEQDSPYPKRVLLLLLSGFLIGLIVIVSIVALVLRFYPLTGFQQANSVVSSPDCGASTLVIGNTTFQIKNLRRGADGSLHVPPEPSGIAYWIQGTEVHPVFILPPTPRNLAVVSTINLGSMATATWSDCTATSYPISAHEPGSFNVSRLPDQSQEGMTAFFLIDSSGAGFVFIAGSSGEQLNVVNVSASTAENTPPSSTENTISPSMENTLPASTANPVVPSAEDTLPPVVEDSSPPSTAETSPSSDSDNSEVQPEIALLAITASPDEKMIIINISVHISGGSLLALSESDMLLSQPDGTLLALKSSEPVLPKEIQPGETETFELAFEHPISPTATLWILGMEYGIEGY